MKFQPPNYLFPIPKGVRPFSMWVIDTMTGLRPADKNGCTVLAVAVCTFSKWVEASPIVDTTSESMVEWVHMNIISRYGKPSVIRTDGGPEFGKVFKEYLETYAIHHRVITPNNSRAAGQVERINGILRAGFRKFASHGYHWFDYLPEILSGMRFITTRSSGLSPYYMTFKQEALHPA
jgi:cleavage and polyadenylation specificity factor subunit 1